MENINEIFKLCDELGITTIGQLKAIRQPGKSVVDTLREIRRKRIIYKHDYKMGKLLNKLDDFICEICGMVTPKDCEGADPNTCEDCNPRDYWEISVKFERKDIE